MRGVLIAFCLFGSACSASVAGARFSSSSPGRGLCGTRYVPPALDTALSLAAATLAVQTAATDGRAPLALGAGAMALGYAGSAVFGYAATAACGPSKVPLHALARAAAAHRPGAEVYTVPGPRFAGPRPERDRLGTRTGGSSSSTRKTSAQGGEDGSAGRSSKRF